MIASGHVTSGQSMLEPILEVSELVVRFGRSSMFADRPKPAADGISFMLAPRKTLGIIGESGSGKSTVLRAILRLVPVEGGGIRYRGRDWLNIPDREMRPLRARIGVVMQNPFLSLSPRLTVAEILAEPLKARGGFSRSDVRDRSLKNLEDCGLRPEFLESRARELSGGQAQRVAIARALALEPDLMILDEPTSALDVSVQAQILNLLQELKSSRGLSVLIVTHDIGVVWHTSDEVLVMRRGEQIEYGTLEKVTSRTTSDYTRSLFA